MENLLNLKRHWTIEKTKKKFKWCRSRDIENQGVASTEALERCATKFLRILDLLEGRCYRTGCLISTEKGPFQMSLERLDNEIGHESGNLVPVCFFANPVDHRIYAFKMSRHDYFHAVGLPIDLSIFTLPGKPEVSHQQHYNDPIYSTISDDDYLLGRGNNKWIGNLLFWDKALSEWGGVKKYGSMKDALRCAAKDLAERRGRFVEQRDGEPAVETKKTLNKVLMTLLKNMQGKHKKAVFLYGTAIQVPSPPSTNQAPATSAQSTIPPALSVTLSAPAASSNKQTKTADVHPFFK